MPIFSRRTLQRLIYGNENFLSRKQTRKHLDSLNLINSLADDAIPTEWEVVNLNALSKVGKVEHERNFGGTTNPDVYFKSNDDARFEFVADITAPSDKGIDQQNSMEPLLRAIQKKFYDNGLNRNHVYLQGGGNAEEVFKREDRARLAWMPGEGRYEQVFFKDAGFVRFFEEIKRNPNESRQYRFDKPIELSVSYNPRQTSAGMTHLDYKQVNLLERNSIFSALRSKYEQLERSGYMGLRGIILCDGGSDAFHHREGDWGLTYGVDQIVRHFLKDDKVRKDIGFVITVTVVSTQTGRYSLPRIIDPSARYAVALKVHVSESGEPARQNLDVLIPKLRDKFLPAVTHAANAVEWIKSDLKHIGGSFEGGSSVGDNEIKLSARLALEVLAGRKQIHDPDDVAVPGTSSSLNPFEEKLNEGRLIEKVIIQKVQDEDDDYITFVFGEPDPSVSEFKST